MNKIIKDYFRNYGLPKSVLKSINDQIVGGLGEEPSDDDLIQECEKYKELARSFQSEVDARITAALAKRKADANDRDQGSSGGSDDDTGADSGDKNSIQQLTALIGELSKDIAALKNEKIANSLAEQATKKLKDIKMTDSEIKGLLFGRSFKSIEEVDDFVEAQEAIHEDILKERQSESFGDGNQPRRSMKESDVSEFKATIGEFKKSLNN